MRGHRLGACLLLTIAGCGGAPAVRDDGIGLTLSPAIGTHYDATIEAESRIDSHQLDLLETFRASYDVIAVDAEGVTLHAHLDHAQLTSRSGPVRLPPASSDGGCSVDFRVSPRGGVVEVSAGADGLCIAELAQPWMEPVLPDGPAHVGDAWSMPDGPVMVGAHGVTAERSETITLAASTGASVDVRWSGTAHAGPVQLHEGESVSMERSVEGSATLAASDGMPRMGAWHATATYAPASTGYLVNDARVRWCMTRDGEPPCAPLVPAPDTREVPTARVYEGEACTTRLSALDATLAAIPIANETASAGEVPAVDHGTQPIESAAPRLVISASSLVLDGRTVSLEGMQQDLETMARNWSILHPRAEFPGRVHVITAPGTPLAAIEPVITALVPTMTLDLIVATGPAPAPPALPAWVGAIPSDPAEAATAMSRAWGAAVGGCSPAITVFGALANVDSSQRAPLLRSGMHEALATCGCGGVDVDAVEALVARTTVDGDVALAALVIPTGNTGPMLRVRGTAQDLATALAGRATTGSAVRLRLH